MSAETFDKDILVKNIKDWVMIDDELNKMKKQIKEYNLQKKQITAKLVQTMKHKNIDCFEINSGTLVYKQTKSKKPITSKFLVDTLKNIYKNDEQVELIIKQIQENRQETTKDTITRKKV